MSENNNDQEPGKMSDTLEDAGAASVQVELFASLTRNAFDFLERGIAEFDKSPKYSVIHFCAAVEMVLKARLMKEHWSLIVSRPDQAKIDKFKAGDFISVTLEDARTRIRDVAGEDIGDDAFNSFRTLANHRNKMVHFFHRGLESDDKAKAQIVAEQCRAWHHLHRLLIRWGTYFDDFGSQVDQADRAMKKHRKYLAAKFGAIKTELDAQRTAGNAPQLCSACDFKAAIADAFDDQIARAHCLVCDHVETQVKLDCPHCNEPIAITNEGFSKCEHCGQAIDPSHLVKALADPLDANAGPANCGRCGGHHTVVELDGRYFCASCFDFTDCIEQCEWCNEYSTGDMEYSYANGCGQCDGQWGHGNND